MSTAYRPLDADGLSTFELLAAHPLILSRFASYCAKEYSGENLLAFLLLQYIDCRASAGHDVSDEFNVLFRDCIRTGSDMEVNLPSDVREGVSGSRFEIREREYRAALFGALEINLGDTWHRYALLKSNPDAHFPAGFTKPRTIPGIAIWNAYLDVRRILGKGPHPAGPNRLQKFMRKLRGGPGA